jgi:hypothetical protein
MAPLVHMVFRPSRTVRDLIVMSCMLDLARDDVSAALDLAVARVTPARNSPSTRARALTGPHRSSWPARLVPVLGLATAHLLSLRHRALLLSALQEVAWFALPMAAVAATGAWLIGFEMQIAAL